MFRDVTFPDGVGRELNIKREWKTRINEAESGREERMSVMSQSRIVIECDFTAYNDTSKRSILDFFEVVEGSLYSFRVRDWHDFEVGYSYTASGWTLGTPVQFGTGDGSTTTFQLKQVYTAGSFSHSRKVTKPRNDADAPVKIYKNGVLQTSGYTLNYATGVVTFSSAPANGHALTWCGLFDLCCRFKESSLGFQSRSRFVLNASNVGLVEVDE